MFSFIYNDQHHTNTDTEFLVSLGMDDEAVESVQWDAADYERQQWQQIKDQRDKRIYAVEWRIHRMYREEQLGLPRSDDDVTIQKLHEYIQALADLPQTFANTSDVVWPELP
ncbi:phage tail assembly chaperone [Endozoicomonas sp. YOMI1]|uniref:phage tail assembly chaperone n=1 Tax=Endozoicomonas sp. YOMI1 TaxID=2828739 RepID=UPI002148A8E6|nr:phage tail assembly chaperone [Endozoicomonas sp. YOMI1]